MKQAGGTVRASVTARGTFGRSPSDRPAAQSRIITRSQVSTRAMPEASRRSQVYAISGTIRVAATAVCTSIQSIAVLNRPGFHPN